jgi:hypothetical protein
MKVQTLFLLSLITFTLCEYSGIKIAVTAEIFKLLTKFDLNSLLQNKTIIDYAETSGKYLFNYEVTCENVTITNIIAPNNVIIDHEKNSDGLPQVKVTAYNIELAIQIDYLYVKYGLIKETMEHPTGDIVISSLEFTFYFTNEGNLVISSFNVEIESLDIDVRKDFLNWLIGVFQGLIKDQVTSKLESLGDTISEEANKMINNEYIYDVGNGLGLNLTFLTKPYLTQILKSEIYGPLFSQLAKYLKRKNFNSANKFEDTLTSILSFGLLGGAFPIDNPEAMPDITPAVDMDFNKEYFTNEVQILVSTYTLNTLLFMGQYLGMLHLEFTNSSHIIFPWNFDTQGLSELFPEFGEKYGENNLEVEMRVYSSNSKHIRPSIESTISGAKLSFNFNLDFLTKVSEREEDDPLMDLSLNVQGELPFTVQVKYDLLTINWGTFNILDLGVERNELGASYDDLKARVDTMLNTYVTKFIKGYTKNVALAALLTLLTKMEFKNFKLETNEGHILASIAANLD